VSANGTKTIRAWVRIARSEGWRVDDRRRAGHVVFYPPDRTHPQIVVSQTPGGGNRSLANAGAMLRRAGLDVRA
jgi:hypothetical protein